MARFMRTDVGSSGHSILRPPVVVNAASAPFIAPGLAINLAPRNAVYRRVTQRRADYLLRKPAVVGAGIVNEPVRGYLFPLFPETLRRAFHSRLRPPVVVGAGGLPLSLAVNLSPSSRPPRTWAGLRSPTVIGPGIVHAPVAIHLTRIKTPPTWYVLRSPYVVTQEATEIFGGPAVTLARQSRGKTRSFLRPAIIPPLARPTETTLARILPPRVRSRLTPPVLIDLTPQVFYPSVTLARNKPAPTVAVLRPPTDTKGMEDQGRIAVRLAYSRRGRPSYRLRPPVVIDLRPQVFVVKRTLTRIRPQPTTTLLRPPTDLVDLQDQGTVRVHLAYSRRGRPIYELRPPTLIDLSPQVYYVGLTLARNKPQPTHVFLRPPVDTIGAEDQGRVAAHLAYSRRGAARSALRPAVVVFTAVELSGPETTLVRIRPPATRSALRPAADTVGIEDQGRVRVTLVRIRPPRTVYRLRPPVDATVFIARPIAVYPAAEQPTGRPWSGLRSPVVIGPSIVYRPVQVRLSPSTDIQSRRRPFSFLSPPAVVQDAALLFFGPRVELAYSRRGRPISVLQPPAVVGAGIFYRALQVHLAPSFRRRGRWLLRPPVIPPVARPVETTLVRDDRRRRKASSRIRVFIAPTRIARPAIVSLAPQTRGKTISSLTPPTVVTPAFVARAIKVTLARITVPPTVYLLKPPTVVAEPRVYRGILTWKVTVHRAYFRPRVQQHLVIGEPPCYGVGTGTVSPSATNTISVDTHDARGSVAAGDAASGTIEAGDSATGTVAPSATNTITDEQREGC